MGNAHSSALAGRSGQAEILSDLPSVVYKQSLGGGQLLKSSLCIHDEIGLVVVKQTYPKQNLGEIKKYEEDLLEIKSRLSSLASPHSLPVTHIQDSGSSVFLLRQYAHSNLLARLGARPFLRAADKLWISYQLLVAGRQLEALRTAHGDIKASNVLLTSWGWVLLADFAPYKPHHLPPDNPASFSLFFDTAGKRTCCVAPERFRDRAAGGVVKEPSAPAGALGSSTPASDVFSLGCVVAELYLDGRPLFDYSSLLAYRTGALEEPNLLRSLPAEVRALVARMIARDPKQRPSCAALLNGPEGRAMFPDWMADVVHPFFARLLRIPPDAAAGIVLDQWEGLLEELGGKGRRERGR
ncbi:hypothetical protein H632_c1078p1, partial [Helicosporidium sp. ATCC 50920]